MKWHLCRTIAVVLAWACLSNAKEGDFAIPEEAELLEPRQSLDGSWLFHSAAQGLSEMPSAPGTFGVVTRDRHPKQDSLEAIKRIFAEGHDLGTK